MKSMFILYGINKLNWVCLDIGPRSAILALGCIDLRPVALAQGLRPRANMTGRRSIWPKAIELAKGQY